jgi:ubiquinone/menaquinone biosynthesis C-methylase UbiE
MTHSDHVRLLQKGVPRTSGGVWSDLGSGDGAFTLALRDLAGEDVEIYSVDKDATRLERQQRLFTGYFPKTTIHFLNQDFSHDLPLPRLDGIIMANSLHYVKDKLPLLKTLRTLLKPQGVFILVEYNVDVGNSYVPYPLSFSTFQKVAPQAGFSVPTLLDTEPSIFLEEIYSAKTYEEA